MGRALRQGAVGGAGASGLANGTDGNAQAVESSATAPSVSPSTPTAPSVSPSTPLMSAGTGGSSDFVDMSALRQRPVASSSLHAQSSYGGDDEGDEGDESAVESGGVRSPRTRQESEYDQSETDWTDMDDSGFHEEDSLLGRSRSPLVPRTPQTHSHLGSACSIPGLLIDSAARSVRRPRRMPQTAGGGGGGAAAGRGGFTTYGDTPAARRSIQADPSPWAGDDCV